MSLFQLQLDIGKICISVLSERGGFVKKLKSRYDSFLSRDNSDCCLKIFLSHEASLDTDATDVHLTQSRGNYLIHAGSFSGLIDLKENKVRVNLPVNENIFNSFLRVLYSVLLLPDKGFLIHSAGLKRDGKGYLFPGPSSSGKTTTAKEAAGFQVLSDELVIVKKQNNGFYLFATPFAGDFNARIGNICAPLEKIFFLNRIPSFMPQRQDKLEATVNLLENVFFFARDLKSNRKIVKLCHEVSSSVTAYRINFLAAKKNGRFVYDN